VHIADGEARRLGHGVCDERGAGGNAGHAQPRLVEIELRDALEQHRDGAWIDVDGHAEGLATESAVMSSWVGPMPPVVKT